MSYIRGSLLAGRFRTWRELQTMSYRDQRNTLITELMARTGHDDVGVLQRMSDAELAGAGAVFVLMRMAGIRDEPTLRTMTLDGQRNTLIAELASLTGLGDALQGYADLDLVRLALRGRGGVQGVLLAGGFMTWPELRGTSPDTQRNTLISHLAHLCDQTTGFFQGMDDAELAGCGAMTVILRDAGIRDAATLAGLTVDEQRNIFIVEIDAFTHEGADLQRFDNGDLVRIALGDHFLLGTAEELRPIPNPVIEALLPQVAVRYRGLRCFGETDRDGDDTPGADEPYVVLATMTRSGATTIRSQIYNDVDAGEVRTDLVELYRGPVHGAAVHVVLMEHDFGDPEAMEAVVKTAADKVASEIEAALEDVPVVGRAAAEAFEWAWDEFGDDIVGWINDQLDFGDNELGQSDLFMNADRLQELAAAPWQVHDRLVYKVESTLMSGEGASYKAVFDVVAI